MGILQKIQGQPEYVRKIILWLAVAALGALMLFFWMRNFQKRMQEFPKGNFQQFQLPSKQDFPQINVPEMDTSTLRQIEEMIKQMEQASSTGATSSLPATTSNQSSI